VKAAACARFHRWVLAATLLAVAAPALPQGEPISLRRSGASPAIGASAHAVQGEPIYTELEILVQRAARLLEDAVVGPRVTLAKGTVLLGFAERDVQRFCRLDPDHRTLGIREPTWVCLIPGENGRFVARYLVPDGKPAGRRRNLDKAVRFEGTEVPMPAAAATELSAEGLFRKEIVFQGAAGGVLRLLYREHYGDGRPALSQELTYDLVPDGPLTVAVKAARIEVLQAGNEGIQYRVIQGF
jgi:hypothetical protein